MNPGSQKSRKLLPQVLLRVLPLSAVVFFAVWYGAHSLIYSSVHTELVEKLAREAEFGAQTIATRLDTLHDGMRAVASNDLVVNSLIDTASRQAYIPTYMQSLRLPGPEGAKISFTDYRGRLIASNTDTLSVSDYFLTESSIAGFYMRLDDTGATFAVPVLYGGRQEGAIIVRYNKLHFQKLMEISVRTDVAAVFQSTRIVQSSNWSTALSKAHDGVGELDDSVVRSAELPGYSALRFAVGEPISKAFAVADRIELIMVGAFGLALIALVLGIGFTAFLTTRPLFAFAEEIKAIGTAGDLRRRAGSAGYAEFHLLSSTFNAMLERMQKVLVSHERLDQENQARKKAEHALRLSERRYRDMIEGSVRGIFICCGEELLFANQAFADMFKFETADKLIATNKVSDIFDPEVYQELRSQLGTGSEKSPKPTRREILVPSADGGEIWYESISRAINWRGAEAVEGSLTDITERKMVEQLKSEFVSIVSHELRTPLTSITGSLGLIQSGALGTLPPQVEPLIKIAHTNTQRLVALVNDILDVEKIEAGHMEFHLESVELSDLCAQSLSENVFYGAKYGVTFEFQPEITSAYVSADKDRLLQVLANLLSNAAKFSPKGGCVVLKLAQYANAIRLSVIDKGPGIPAAKQATIFEKFKQADSSDSRAKAGTGLGLAICQSIAEHHGSRIEISSVEGEGSVFFFDLKRIASPSQAVDAPEAQTGTKIAV